MSSETTSPPPASPMRADAARNRALLLDTARGLFQRADGETVSLEAIARSAGLGIGTLYRHFPTREALVAALYRSELDELSSVADELLADRTADDALRSWIVRYAEFVATKHGMRDALQLAWAGDGVPLGETRTRVTAVIDRLLAAGAADGTLRADVRPDDVTATLVGVFLATPRGADDEQRRRMFDLVVDGLLTRG
jgi:AcrR family transcriptional regulator